MKARIVNLIDSFAPEWYFPEVRVADVLEILILAYLVYQLMVWIKNTKAWMLLKGIAVLAVFILLAFIFKMNTILWIAQNLISVLATLVIVVFQPELRRALEKLGQKNFWSSVVSFERSTADGRFSPKTMDAIVTACYAMGQAKTGALIVVEKDIVLTEYQHTGIEIDCIVSDQIIQNIFEHNTPLHDGAVIVRGDRIVAATCYLPLTDDTRLSKELGTRHRAAIGMSEVSDALVIVVSEETGNVSYAVGGHLTRGVSREQLQECLEKMLNKPEENKKFTLKKGKHEDERQVEK